jgi:oxygen-dependent protoporphyrinogen oxidase
VPEPTVVTADAVVVATPAAKAARLLDAVAGGAARALAGITSASVAIVTLAYPRDALASPLPAGSGLLVPASERRSVKAGTYLSQKWPHVGSPAGLVVLRASVGRAGEEWQLHRDDGELLARVRAELGTLIGLRGQPLDGQVSRWGGALPQYEVGHGDRVSRARGAVREVPGLALCGAYLDGVGIPACIAAARAAATSVLADLRRIGNRGE